MPVRYPARTFAASAGLSRLVGCVPPRTQESYREAVASSELPLEIKREHRQDASATQCRPSRGCKPPLYLLAGGWGLGDELF
jgi:hypothetical protein